MRRTWYGFGRNRTMTTFLGVSVADLTLKSTTAATPTDPTKAVLGPRGPDEVDSSITNEARPKVSAAHRLGLPAGWGSAHESRWVGRTSSLGSSSPWVPSESF